MSEDFTYRKAIAELSRLVNRDKLRNIQFEGGAVKGLKMRLIDLLRTAVEKSSMSVFNGKMYVFTGKVYESIGEADFSNLTYELWGQLGLPMTLWDKKSGGVVDMMRTMIYSKHIYPDNSKVVFENGLYDFDTHKFCKEVTKSTVQFSVVPFNYNSFAQCPNWQMFLDSVLPNKDYQGMLQEFLGSIFIDRKKVKIETMLILKGDGANGKSVIFETVMGLLGKDNVSTYGISELVCSHLKEQNMSKINGKRLNYCSELNAFNVKGENDVLKALISGEPMTAKVLYANPFKVYDIPLLMSNCNKLPKIDGWSHGMRRRIVIIPFDIQIPVEKQNPRLAIDLANEYAGIFNWICIGRERFRLNGCKFTEVPGLTNYLDTLERGASNEASAIRYIYSKDKIGIGWPAFDYARTSQTVLRPTYRSLRALYENYRKWCKRFHVEPQSEHVFRDELKLAGFEYCRKTIGMCFKLYEINGKIDLYENLRK